MVLGTVVRVLVLDCVCHHYFARGALQPAEKLKIAVILRHSGDEESRKAAPAPCHLTMVVKNVS